MSVSFTSYRHPINIQCDPECCSLGEDVANLRLEVGGERRAAVVELATVGLRKLNS